MIYKRIELGTLNMDQPEIKIDNTNTAIQYGAFMLDVKLKKIIQDVAEAITPEKDGKTTTEEHDLLAIRILKECLEKYEPKPVKGRTK